MTETSASAPAEGATLTNRQLNRSLLARQHLLERSAMDPAAMIAHLVGMQSQVPSDPFTGLWSRIPGFLPSQLDQLMLDRETVRILTMRGTIHLLTREDAQMLWPLMQADLIRLTTRNRQWAPHFEGVDVGEVQELGNRLLTETPMSMRELRDHLAARWPDRDPEALSRLVHFGLPLAQVTPRGLWKRSMSPTVTPLDAWLGEPTPATAVPDAVILRYLRSFGPASTADFRTWSRLTRMKEAFARVRPGLVSYRDERGRELLDLPDAPFSDAETPAPVRFLPRFENALLSHDDRSRIVPLAARAFLASKNGLPPATFLVDGYVAGTWKASRNGERAAIDITPFEGLTPATREEVEGEGLCLLRFLEDGAETFDVIVGDVAPS
jgi:hypothetical protein